MSRSIHTVLLRHHPEARGYGIHSTEGETVNIRIGRYYFWVTEPEHLTYAILFTLNRMIYKLTPDWRDYL